MDIHIILNPGAVGTPPKAQQRSKKKTYSSPTSAQSSPGSAICRRSSLRSSSVGTRPPSIQKKSYATTPPKPIPIRQHHSTSVIVRQPPSSPLVRQSRTRKRVLYEGEEIDAVTGRSPAKRGRSNSTSTSTHSSSAGSFESAATRSTASASHARLLLSRAKQHVALEAVTLGRRTRSMMDVVMDLKGPGVFMFDFVADRTQDASYRHRDYASYHSYASYSYLGRDNSYNYALTDAEGLAAYWAEQAAIWTDGARIDSADLDSDSDAEVTLARTRFPVSMERSTASWECP